MEVNPLDPKLIPKYTQELVIPPSFLPTYVQACEWCCKL